MRWVSDTVADQILVLRLGPTFGRDRQSVYAAVDGSHRKVPWVDLENWRIARIDLMTGSIEPEMGGTVGRVGMRPAVSPDARYLAYATSSGSRVGLRLRDLQTDQERWLVQEEAG